MANLKKDVGAFGVFSIATGAMISSGIFILPGMAYAKVGPAVFVSYFFAGLLGLIGVLSMIELATAMPKAGGDFYFINKTFGPLVGSISGFLGWFALSLKSAFAIFGISEILFLYTGISPLISGFFLCFLFVALNILGVKEAAFLQTGMVIILLVLMVVYIAAGLPRIEMNYFEGIRTSKLNTILITSGFIFISFGGLLKVANISEEVANPKKNLPLGMISSIIAVTLLYTLMTFVVTGTLAPGVFAKSLTPIADSARLTMGAPGYIIVIIASTLAFFTTANAGILAASRYPLALSLDKLLPPFFARLMPKKETPVVAITITGTVIYLALLLPIETLVKAASTVILTSYILTNLSVVIFRESKITNYRPSYKAPFYPWLQILSIILFSFFIYDLGFSAIEISGSFLLVGIVVYLLYGRKKASKESAFMHLLKRVTDEALKDNTFEDEFREILITRDNIEQDHLDLLIKNSPVIQIDKAMDFETLVAGTAENIGRELSLEPEELVQKYKNRQEESDTALTEFVAIPHVVIDGENKMFMRIVHAKGGIFFSKEKPSVKAVFFLGGTKDNKHLHLKTIAALASLVSEPDFETKWLKIDNEADLKNMMILNSRKRFY